TLKHLLHVDTPLQLGRELLDPPSDLERLSFAREKRRAQVRPPPTPSPPATAPVPGEIRVKRVEDDSALARGDPHFHPLTADTPPGRNPLLLTLDHHRGL